MQNGPDVLHKIKELEKRILEAEANIEEFSQLHYDEGIKKALHGIGSDLKYMGILSNGCPVDKKEDRRIMDFLRVHYDYLRKMSVGV